jgi:hypothetical protein
LVDGSENQQTLPERMSQAHLYLQQEFDLLSVRYPQLRASLSSRKHEGGEHEPTRKCCLKFANELCLMKGLMEFDSIAQLRSKIQKLVDSRDKLKSAFSESEPVISDLLSESRDVKP